MIIFYKTMNGQHDQGRLSDRYVPGNSISINVISVRTLVPGDKSTDCYKRRFSGYPSLDLGVVFMAR